MTNSPSVAEMLEMVRAEGAGALGGCEDELKRGLQVALHCLAHHGPRTADAEFRQRVTDLQRLRKLETTDDLVRRYLKVFRLNQDRAAESAGDELDADVLLGLAEVLAESREATRATFAQYVERNVNPPMLIVTEADISDLMKPGGIVIAGSAPREFIAREDITLMDFFKAFWRRLTRPRDT